MSRPSSWAESKLSPVPSTDATVNTVGKVSHVVLLTTQPGEIKFALSRPRPDTAARQSGVFRHAKWGGIPTIVERRQLTGQDRRPPRALHQMCC
jgi:hypothetical protein